MKNNMESENVNDMLSKAEHYYKVGHLRDAAILIHQVLLSDFTNMRAWRLLYLLQGSPDVFENFRVTFARKYYPERAHLLVSSKLLNNDGHATSRLDSILRSSQPPIENPKEIANTPNAVTNISLPKTKPQGQANITSAPIRYPAQSGQINNVIFCASCGTQNRETDRICTQCGTSVMNLSRDSIQGLLQSLSSCNDHESRKEVMNMLGRLKLRQAIPTLIDIAHSKGSKKNGEDSIAISALEQIIDFSTSFLTCQVCENDNPVNAHFCAYCGTPVVRPVATQQEVSRLISQVRDNSSAYPIRAVQKLGQLQAKNSISVLLDKAKYLKKMGTEYYGELYILSEALVDIGQLSIQDIWKTFPNGANANGVYYSQVLSRLGYRDAALKHMRERKRPATYLEDGGDLIGVLEAGKFGEVQDILVLCNDIKKEKKVYDPRISAWGYFLYLGDPVGLLVTAISSVAYTVIINKINQKINASFGGAYSSWVIVPADVADFMKLQGLPKQVRLILTLHCYSTALAMLAGRYLNQVQQEFSRRTNPLELAVLGLALADRGDLKIINTLNRIKEDRDWSTRILAYEALYVLSSKTDIVVPQNILSALNDSDQRVKMAIAKIMTENNADVYEPYVLKLADTESKDEKKAIIPMIAKMAQDGSQKSLYRLREIANKDTNKDVREMASNLLALMKSSK